MTFKFPPPPPPPPPKATSNEQTYPSQREGHNRGGGETGRGRGGYQNRGGGFHNAAGNSRGGHGQNRGRGDARGRGQRGGYQTNRGGGYHRNDTRYGHGNDLRNAPQKATSPEAHANPQSPPFAYSQPGPQYSPPKHAGQKRKLNDRNGNAQSQRNSQQHSSKPPRAKAAVPPQVPSFGFSLPLPSIPKPDNKKRKVTLGLSQKVEQDESSGEEDVDEEAAFSAKLKSGGFAFEHEGETITIQTGAEVAAWIKDRRKNFPTQQRIIEKQEEAARKRSAELEFLRRMKGKPPKESEPVTPIQKQPNKDRNGAKTDSAKQEAEKRRQEELATLRKKLHESMVKKQSAPATVDLGLGYDSETESDEESSVLSESSVVSSSEESDSDSGSDSGSDEAPETASSKTAPPPIKVPPPPPATSRAETKSKKMCTNWKRNGRCPYLSKCKYQHPPKEEDNKRQGLYERMVEQELVKADQLALDAIKYLGQNGFLG
ncbi:hypothetical protein COCMIDRAFT_40158 [Bipolaris oryzae ATCC 44560]|uniref:C3H1-type domain-containing protein n=1 Tax=Bipolaris oryzae ATCC 44560 TaxID=930090 RepID=W6ZDW5_COCMI|nr:uncharacterized protein COCMIDRAFT_40158 [Bipolaris oryzae ATCC 44560]EUC41701.1 hypothetical protein COCMIDRAFT_40158 [Bipolaris oryzae ATCC 44560]